MKPFNVCISRNTYVTDSLTQGSKLNNLICSPYPAWQTFYRTLSLHIYDGGKVYLRDMKNQKDLITFLKGHDVTSWFFRISASTKLKCAYNNSSPKRKQIKKQTNQNLAFFKGYIYSQEMFAILTINAPKWRWSVTKLANMAISELCNVFYWKLLCAFRLNSNYKKNSVYYTSVPCVIFNVCSVYYTECAVWTLHQN